MNTTDNNEITVNEPALAAETTTQTETPAEADLPADANPSAGSTPPANPKRPVSEARLRANRENAKNSSGPKTPEGKSRSRLNATRHGILSQVIHLPEEEMKSYDKFTARYVADLKPVGAVETELANACSDLQFRLHRLAAAEHNLFAIGHDENGEAWEPGHPESHSALTFAETIRNSKDPLATLTTYEQRLSRRLLQTLNKLHQMQEDRKALAEHQLAEMTRIALQHPDQIEVLDPIQFGFVCSKQDWQLYWKRYLLNRSRQKGVDPHSLPKFNVRKLLNRIAA